MLSSAEVGTLITALGSGIGRDDFDIDKLRYHRDHHHDRRRRRRLATSARCCSRSSTARCRELIERGHIYIAQPPLYKVKRGKQEIYVKDEAELNQLLLRIALDDAALHVNGARRRCRARALETLARQYMEVQAIIAPLGAPLRRAPARAAHLHAARSATAEFATTPTGSTSWASELEAAAQRRRQPRAQLPRRPCASQRRPARPRTVVSTTEHGRHDEKHLQKEFFESAEYRRIAELGTTLAA